MVQHQRLLQRLGVLLLSLWASSAAAQAPRPFQVLLAPANITTASQVVNFPNIAGTTTTAFQINGTFSAGTIALQCSINNQNWQAVNITPTNSSTVATSASATGLWTASLGGCRYARFAADGSFSGTVAVSALAVGMGGGGGAGGGGGGGSVTQGTDPWLVAGKLSNNGAAPSTNNVGALTAIANAAAPSWTEGRLVGLSVDLSGALRVSGSAGGTSAADNSAFTAGTTSLTPVGCFYHSTVDTVTDVRTAAIGCDSKRNVFTVIRDAAGNARGANVDTNNNLGIVLPAETTKVIGTVRALGNAGAIFDQATGSAVPANALYTGINVSGTMRGMTGVNPTGTVYAPQFDLASIAGAVPSATSFLPVRFTNGTAYQDPSTQGTQDGALGTITNVTGGLNMMRASAAAPSNVSADDDAVLPWALRNGSPVVNLALGGTLVAGLSSGLPVKAVGNTGAIFDGATAAAPPANVLYMGGVTSGATGGLLQSFLICDGYAFDRSTTADVQLVGITSGRSVYVCGYRISGESTTTSDVNLRYATNADCTTGAANLTPATTVGTSTSGGMIGGVVVMAPLGARGLATPAGDNLCVHRTAAQTSEVEVWYAKF